MCGSSVRSPEGKLTLYCKGADTIIYERLHASSSKLMEVTTEHLNVSYICVFHNIVWVSVWVTHVWLTQSQEYAGEGLRTLALAYKDLDEDEFEKWKERHHEASTTLEDREAKLDAIYEEIEKDLLVKSPSHKMLKCCKSVHFLLFSSFNVSQ